MTLDEIPRRHKWRRNVRRFAAPAGVVALSVAAGVMAAHSTAWAAGIGTGAAVLATVTALIWRR